MSATLVSPLFSLPNELLFQMSSYLGKDIKAFRTTCDRFREIAEPHFELFRKVGLFVEQYGARAECEKDTPVDTLLKRVESVSVINTILGIDLLWEKRQQTDHLHKILHQIALVRDFWLEITLPPVPRLRHYDVPLQELLKTREFHLSRDEKVNMLFELQNKAALEFNSRPLNPAHPLQDLRNRSRRLQTLNDERKSLQYARMVSNASYKAFLNKLLPNERVSFPLVDEVPIHIFPVMVQLSNYRIIELGRTSLIFQGEEISVAILASLGYTNEFCDHFSGQTVFSIIRTDTLIPSRLGSLAIERQWDQTMADGSQETYYSEASFDAEDDGGILTNRRLCIEDMEDNLGLDSTNGDRPIMRLLEQLAFEIFQLEPEEKHLIIDTQVPFAEYYIHLVKSLHSNPQTNLVFSDANGQERPAMVYGSPITWEEQIARHPLLSLKKGPILPMFFKRNLFRFEKPKKQ